MINAGKRSSEQIRKRKKGNKEREGGSGTDYAADADSIDLPLPSIVLTNLGSLKHKVDAIQTYTYTVTNFVKHLCYASQKAGYNLLCLTLFLKSLEMHFRGKSKVGGICVHINYLWCRVHSVKSKICNSNVEILMTLRPFYLLRI